MNLSKLKDHEVLARIKSLVENERTLLTSILHHLREVEKRRLFSELKYPSLFEYAMKELKYSEAQAVRRIKAMRLLKELPQLEEKIQSGSLNLSNLCQAQTYFRSADKKAKSENTESLSAQDKIEVLSQLENKSAREGEKLLLSLQPEISVPIEKERILSANLTEVRFSMDETLKANLEKVRSLLGLKGLGMSFAELANEMALMSIQLLNQKAFGKKRATAFSNSEQVELRNEMNSAPVGGNSTHGRPTSAGLKTTKNSPSTSKVSRSLHTPSANYLSKELKFRVWQRDRGQCTACGSRSNLNYDHVHPKALGGGNAFENIRLLCFHCNQRRATATFGANVRCH